VTKLTEQGRGVGIGEMARTLRAMPPNVTMNQAGNQAGKPKKIAVTIAEDMVREIV